MDTTIVNLRYKMKEILAALNRREKINILYHGKIKGTILPVNETPTLRVDQHPLFGILKKSKKSVEDTMTDLRGDRYK